MAHELATAYATHQTTVVPPSAREPGFDLSAAYAVEAQLVKLREETGRKTVGRKVGFANKAMWRVLKLDTVVWAHLYDDTVRVADQNHASLSAASFASPKIEPEIVFKLRHGLNGEPIDAAGALRAVEWIALGFEIIDCLYADWTFQPADFVAAYGLHAALVVGEPRPVEPAAIPTLVEQLASFKVALMRDGQVVAEGGGRNVLRSPALCLAELALAAARRRDATPLAAGEIISTGTLTESQPMSAGETWTARVDGIGLRVLTVTV